VVYSLIGLTEYPMLSGWLRREVYCRCPADVNDFLCRR